MASLEPLYALYLSGLYSGKQATLAKFRASCQEREISSWSIVFATLLSAAYLRSLSCLFCLLFSQIPGREITGQPTPLPPQLIWESDSMMGWRLATKGTPGISIFTDLEGMPKQKVGRF